MMEHLLNWLNFFGFALLQYIFLAVFAWHLFQPAHSKRTTGGLLCLLIAAAYCGTLLLGHVSFLLKIGFSMLLHTFAWRFSFEEKLGKLFFFNFVFYYELMIADFIVGSFATTATGANVLLLIASDTAGRFLVSLVSLLCAAILMLATTFYFKKRPLEIPNKYWCIVDIVILLCYLTSLLVMSLNEYAPLQQYSVTTLVLSVLFPVLFFLIIKMFVDLCSFFHTDKNMAVTQIASDALQKQLALQEKSLQDIRKIRHDMKNHLLSLSALLRANNTDAAVQYLSDLSQSIDGSGVVAYCKNAAVNSILNAKRAEAAACGCTLSLSVDPDFDVPLPLVDITCILANLVDNAIEAVQTLSCAHRTITVQLGRYNALFYFRVSNAYRGKLKKRGETILTSKPDAASHGYGIESVKASTIRCGGMLQINDANQVFTATAFVKGQPVN